MLTKDTHSRMWLQIKKFKNNYFHSKVYCVYTETIFAFKKIIWGRLGREGDGGRGRPLKVVL